MIRINCFVQVSEENRAAVLTAAKELTEASRRQEGCISYDIFESATRPDVLLFCETWADATVLAAHAASEVFVKNVALMKELAQLKIEQFEF